MSRKELIKLVSFVLHVPFLVLSLHFDNYLLRAGSAPAAVPALEPRGPADPEARLPRSPHAPSKDIVPSVRTKGRTQGVF